MRNQPNLLHRKITFYSGRLAVNPSWDVHFPHLPSRGLGLWARLDQQRTGGVSRLQKGPGPPAFSQRPCPPPQHKVPLPLLFRSIASVSASLPRWTEGRGWTPGTCVSTLCSRGFLSSGLGSTSRVEPWGVFPASGGIHVGTSVFSQKPDPRLSLPNPAQPMASFSFLFFFLRKQLCFRFYPQTFLKPLSKLAECTGHMKASTTFQDKLRFLKRSLFLGPFFSGGRWGGGESLQKLETRAPYTREGLSSGQTIPPPLPEPCPGGNVNVTFHKPYPPCGLGHRLELAKICVRKSPCPG